MLKVLARLNAVSDAAWSMAARAKDKGNNDKAEADALRLAKNSISGARSLHGPLALR